MIKTSVCIEMFWKGEPEEKKIKRVKNLGFVGFEFWGWKGKNIEKIKKSQEETGLEATAFCFEPSGALTSDKIQIKDLIKGGKETARTAKILGCKKLILTVGNVMYGETYEITRRKVIKKLKELSKIMEEENLILLIEPLNPIVDHEGYYLTKMSEAVDIVEEVNSKNLKILYDIYHQQITEGNIISTIQKYISYIGHFHAAGIPGRHELTEGELNYRKIFETIHNTGYNGFIGLEFTPTKEEDEVSLKESLNLLCF